MKKLVIALCAVMLVTLLVPTQAQAFGLFGIFGGRSNRCFNGRFRDRVVVVDNFRGGFRNGVSQGDLEILGALRDNGLSRQLDRQLLLDEIRARCGNGRINGNGGIDAINFGGFPAGNGRFIQQGGQVFRVR